MSAAGSYPGSTSDVDERKTQADHASTTYAQTYVVPHPRNKNRVYHPAYPHTRAEPMAARPPPQSETNPASVPYTRPRNPTRSSAPAHWHDRADSHRHRIHAARSA